EHSHRNAPPQDGDQWRVNFSRVEWQHEIVTGEYRKIPRTLEDNWVWSPQGVVDMHRPESLGYVQFSTSQSGQATSRIDSSAPIRDRLMQLYYAQRAFFSRNKKWATSLTALGLPAARNLANHTTSIRLTPEGFEAAITLTSSSKKTETWTVRED